MSKWENREEGMYGRREGRGNERWGKRVGEGEGEGGNGREE